MTFQIQRIVLYRANGEIRELKLKTDAVNIITGASKTGKSAIIHIVDYCMGGSESFVPEGVIVKNCAWYGLHIVSGRNELFIARRNPGPGKKSSEDIYLLKGKDLEIPEFGNLAQNINSEGLRELLSTFVGIGNYSYEVKTGFTRNSGVANISKALIYCFQEQSEIDSQKILFHRQGEQFIPQSIQDYMPFFLGAVSQDYSINKEKLRAKQRQLAVFEAKKAELERIKGRSLVRALNLISEAKSVGLIDLNTPVNDNWGDIKKLLVGAESRSFVKDGDFSAYGQQLQLLHSRQSALRDKYRGKTDEISALNDFKNGGDGFTVEAKEQKARLTSLELIPEESNEACPLCNSKGALGLPNISALKKSLKEIVTQLENVSNDITHVDKMIVNSQAELEQIGGEMRQTASEIEALYGLDKKFQKIRDENSRKSLIQGRIGLYLEALKEPQEEYNDQRIISALKRDIDKLEKEVGETEVADKFNSVLNILSHKITQLAKSLELEHSQYTLRLDPKKLTVIADTEDGPLPLARMGSGETWVSIHLIVHLVLHQWFHKKKLPVPNFVIFDQPSQAYFPPETTDETIRKNSDRQAVINMFSMIKEQTEGFQVIITEHADIAAKWYQDMVLEKWWDGSKKLVPVEWTKSSTK